MCAAGLLQQGKHQGDQAAVQAVLRAQVPENPFPGGWVDSRGFCACHTHLGGDAALSDGEPYVTENITAWVCTVASMYMVQLMQAAEKGQKGRL